jgi:hypothetical protein
MSLDFGMLLRAVLGNPIPRFRKQPVESWN